MDRSFIEEYLEDVKRVSNDTGWEVTEMGVFRKNSEVTLYTTYKGQGVNVVVYNQTYHDIITFTEYYTDWVDGNRAIDEVTELIYDIVKEIRDV